MAQKKTDIFFFLNQKTYFCVSNCEKTLKELVFIWFFGVMQGAVPARAHTLFFCRIFALYTNQKMTDKTHHLITSALPYANGALHLGHLAGAYLPADIYARYLRLKGEDVAFVCGSDEHGAAITMRAKKEGVSPREIIDKYHHLNKETFERLGISFDIYHRTSDPLHYETAQEIFLRLYEKGDEFEERETEQYFDEEYGQFLADRYITGTCPKCGYEEAYGDQCEKCGSALSPLELVNPRSTLSGQKPSLKKTKHWYFRLDKHEGWLREWIGKGRLDGQFHHDPKTWKKHVIGQCMSWLDGRLIPRAITRDLDWGIPVPLPEAEGKVLYVWFDAPIGYISATRQWAAEQGKNWEDYWKGPNARIVHFIGKDNIVFHCIVFPAVLKAHGEYQLPVNVPANQFLNFEGHKFSKSRGWGIEQHEYLKVFKDFPNKEDALRYALLRNMPENRDSDFRWDEFADYHDKDLADKLGNFVNRVLVLTNKYYGGKVPDSAFRQAQDIAFRQAQDIAFRQASQPDGERQAQDIAFRQKMTELAQNWAVEIEAFSFRNAANAFVELCELGNTYLQEKAPWALWKENPEHPEIAACLNNALQLTALLSIVTQPFIPFTSAKMRQLLKLPELRGGEWKDALQKLEDDKPLLDTGHQIGKPEILFAKIYDRKDDSRLRLIEAQKAKVQTLLEEEKKNQAPRLKPTVQFDDFTKLDLRTGTITAAEKIPKANKLLKVEVDLGFEKRTVVAGIAEYYQAEDLIGQRVVLLANLAPRKLRGVESRGMILMADNAEGRPGFLSPPEGWPNGFPIR